jgi:hypothetical protein
MSGSWSSRKKAFIINFMESDKMRKNISKDLIIEKTIETNQRERWGSNNVNLRAVARAIGCNHTKYIITFPNFEELLIESLKCFCYSHEKKKNIYKQQ